MKNITFSAKEEAIEKARKVAARQHSTLNEMFREWLEKLNAGHTETDDAARLEKLWQRTSYLRTGKKYSRDEMNQR